MASMTPIATGRSGMMDNRTTALKTEGAPAGCSTTYKTELPDHQSWIPAERLPAHEISEVFKIAQSCQV
jgi:hypothetical protein